MKRPLLICCAILLSFNTSVIAQSRQTEPSAVGNQPGTSIDPELASSILISGTVVVDDGTPLPSAAAIYTVCKGQKRLVTHSSITGEFSFVVGSNGPDGGAFDASMSASGGSPFGHTESPLHNQREWRECGIQASLSGFRSEVVEVTSRTDSFHATNFGTLVLRRNNPNVGVMVSATSAAAPDAAKKALLKGLELDNKNQWDAAQESLEKAVKIYPQYASAWFELGRVQIERNDVAGAKRSFTQSVAADPHYVSPYLGLTQIAASAANWRDLADLTGKIIELNSTSSPQIWYDNGVANYNLDKLPEADKSAREGIKIDREHHLPRLEHLLATILMEQHDYAGANEHMQNYLQFASNPADITEAKTGLAEIAKHTNGASASTASTNH